MRLQAAVAAILILTATGSSIAAGRNGHTFSGVAAYYDRGYHGRTASGAHYNPNALTAAHRSLPFGTRVRVIEQRSGRSVEVVVNDRGPFNRGRVIDLSLAAAKELQMVQRGLTRVTVFVMER
jgi:rare lipoprotein A